MNQIEETIQQVERLYQRATGDNIPNEKQSLPVVDGVNPVLLLEEKLNHLLNLLEEPQIIQKLQPLVPPMNVWESQDNYLIRVDMPGVKKEDVDLTIKGQYLIITGVRKNLQEITGLIPKLLEVPTGYFQKTVNLPEKYGTTEIHSEILNGILEIKLPKTTKETKEIKKSKVQ